MMRWGVPLALLCTGAALQAQTPAPAAPDIAWQTCTTLAADRDARLACFDRWALRQGAAPVPAQPATPVPPTPVDASLPATRVIAVATEEGCRDRQYSDLSRFWELESGSDCGTFGIRGYRPISLSLIGSDGVNTQPSSANPLNTASSAQPFRRTETRIQLSVRTKIAQGLLTQGHPTLKDSLWFGYSQQSYWQLFTPQISRPFRVTDHEPEVVYVYPTDAQLPGGWRWRYSGLGLVHQSNGQSLPLSRSWNRVYLMTGLEKDSCLRLQARVWQRVPEKAANDDNPDISSFVGRAELAAFWNPNADNTLGLTLRHALARPGRGSARLEWLQTLGSGEGGHTRSSLRLHTQLFSGYGDSLLDYNRRRTVFSIGLSLVDF